MIKTHVFQGKENLMEFKIKYYKDLVSFHIPDQNVLGNILPNTAPAAVSEAEEVARALSVPFGTPRLSEIVRSGEKIVIVTSDITRPVPSKIIIPRLLDELGKAGVKDEDVTIVFGLGSHRKQTEEEQKSLVGEEVYSRVKCVDSDPEDCVHLGTCKNGDTGGYSFRRVGGSRSPYLVGNVEMSLFC